MSSCLRLSHHLEHALVVLRHDLVERRERRRPTRRAAPSRPSDPVSSAMTARRSSSEERSVDVVERLELDHLVVDERREHAGRVVHVARCRRTCRRRSCARSCRAPRRAPPVMYSQPWSPTPSTTAVAPELRTQNRSPTTPRRSGLAARRAVQRDVARDDVLLGHERSTACRGTARAVRPRGPCRSSRSRRPRAAA